MASTSRRDCSTALAGVCRVMLQATASATAQAMASELKVSVLALLNSGCPPMLTCLNITVPSTVITGINSAGTNSRLPRRTASLRFSSALVSS